MKLSNAIEKGNSKYWTTAHVRKNVRKNPTTDQDWFVMLIGPDEKQYMLVDEAEKPIVHSDINQLVELLSLVGLSSFNVFI
tara:strand:- start:35146 stop:35388 length:243 start_codon:yes stop_codon:yes gene_type:complete